MKFFTSDKSPLTSLRIFLRPRGREAFVRSLPRGAVVLDVGCGGNSPAIMKRQRPDIHYVGIDIGDYNHTIDPSSFADEYIICAAGAFSETISIQGCRFDAVISAHNIEHCDDPAAVLAAIASVLLPGGQLYMAWPGEHTVNLPSRAGCLNFHDDPTHQNMPVFDDIMKILKECGVNPVFSSRAYKPVIPYLIGGALEPLSVALNRQAPFKSTWAFHGFESIVWFQSIRAETSRS